MISETMLFYAATLATMVWAVPDWALSQACVMLGHLAVRTIGMEGGHTVRAIALEVVVVVLWIRRGGIGFVADAASGVLWTLVSRFAHRQLAGLVLWLEPSSPLSQGLLDLMTSEIVTGVVLYATFSPLSERLNNVVYRAWLVVCGALNRRRAREADSTASVVFVWIIKSETALCLVRIHVANQEAIVRVHYVEHSRRGIRDGVSNEVIRWRQLGIPVAWTPIVVAIPVVTGLVITAPPEWIMEDIPSTTPPLMEWAGPRLMIEWGTTVAEAAASTVSPALDQPLAAEPNPMGGSGIGEGSGSNQQVVDATVGGGASLAADDQPAPIRATTRVKDSSEPDAIVRRHRQSGPNSGYGFLSFSGYPYCRAKGPHAYSNLRPSSAQRERIAPDVEDIPPMETAPQPPSQDPEQAQGGPTEGPELHQVDTEPENAQEAGTVEAQAVGEEDHEGANENDSQGTMEGRDETPAVVSGEPVEPGTLAGEAGSEGGSMPKPAVAFPGLAGAGTGDAIEVRALGSLQADNNIDPNPLQSDAEPVATPENTPLSPDLAAALASGVDGQAATEPTLVVTSHLYASVPSPFLLPTTPIVQNIVHNAGRALGNISKATLPPLPTVPRSWSSKSAFRWTPPITQVDETSTLEYYLKFAEASKRRRDIRTILPGYELPGFWPRVEVPPIPTAWMTGATK